MLIVAKRFIAATALVPLGLTLQLAIETAYADCLSNVEIHRSQLEDARSAVNIKTD